MTTIEVLERIRQDLWHKRNAFLYPPFGEAQKYARWVEDADEEIDAINQAICVLQIQERAHA